MKTRLLNLIDVCREGFWLMPFLISVACVLAALGMTELDQTFASSDPEDYWFVSNATAARQMLGSISSIVLTQAGIVFSVTLVAISMASSQFGSRLLRSFMSDNFSDRVIGLLFGTSLFCFIVTYQIKSADGGQTLYVPQYSLATAVILGLFSVATLIWFVHQTATGLQAPRLISRVADDLNDAVERLFPKEIACDATEMTARHTSVVLSGYAKTVAVQIQCDGYVEGVDFDSLMAIAKEANGLIEVHARPGAFVHGMTEIATLYSNQADSESSCDDAIRSAFVVGPRRTPRQDIACSIIELVEIATRALSPGINNPFAATNCIDRLSAALSRLAGRPFPFPNHVDEDQVVRAFWRPHQFNELISDSFSLIRQHGASSVAVAIRLVEGFDRIAAQVKCPKDMTSIRQQADALRSDFLNSNPADVDREDFERRYKVLQRFWSRASYP